MPTDANADHPDDFSTIHLSDILPRAQVAFDVPQQPAIPKGISEIPDVALQQRAADAWDAAWTLQATWGLWGQFLLFGAGSMIPDKPTQDAIESSFPSLALFGHVLEALSKSRPLRGKHKEARKAFDDLAGIKRGRIGRMTRAEISDLRGPRLQELIVAFQKIVSTRVRVLFLQRLKSPEFQRPQDEILDDAMSLMKVDLDFVSGKAPINFMIETKRLTDPQVRRSRAAIANLLSILEQQPTSALIHDADLVKDADTECPDDEEENVVAEVAGYLEVNVQRTGKVKRKGYEKGANLPPIRHRIMEFLVRAAGQAVSFDSLRSAWPVDGGIPDDKSVHREMGRLRKDLASLGLLLKNRRGKGYYLVEAVEAPE